MTVYSVKRADTNGLSNDMRIVAKSLVNWHMNRGSEYGEASGRMYDAMFDQGLDYVDGKWIIAERQIDSAILTKSADDKQLVFGWANVIATEDDELIIDRQKDFIDNEWEIEKAAYDYMLKSRSGSMEHMVAGVGNAVESMVFTKDKQSALGIPTGVLPVGWWLGFHVHDEASWELVKSGKVTSFSIHGKGKRTPVKVGS